MFDGEAFGQQMVEIVRGYMDSAVTPLLERIDAQARQIEALEKRELALPEKGEPGEPGLPGEKGDPGEVDKDALEAMVAVAITEAVASLPRAEKGDPGRDVDMAEVGSLIETAVKSAVAALPAPRDGEPGKDGIGLADVLRDADGGLVIVMTDGRTKSLGQIDGKDGEPGADGITPTFLDAEFVGRTLRLSFDGERSCEFQLATPEYLGVFKEGQAYEPGDMVTWGGSLWHCDKATSEKPGPDNWSLAVKKGRDGKDAGK